MINKKSIWLPVLMLSAMSSCTGDFEQINTSETATTTIEPAYLFTKAQVTGSGLSYTVSQNLNQTSTMAWAQHFANIQPTFTGDRHEPGAENTVWDFYYSDSAFRPLLTTYLAKEQIALQGGNPIQMAMINIWDTFMYQRLTDLYGDIPYSDAFIGTRPKYDPQSAIYTTMLTLLDEAIAALENPDNSGYPTFGNADVFYQSNKAKWVKFATTLKLKLALHQSKAAPETTRAIIATIDPSKIIQENADNVVVRSEIAANAKTHYTKNTWGFVFNWNEVRISKNLMRHMDGTVFGVQDPRLVQYANPTQNFVDGKTSVKYVGLENGIDNLDLQADQAYYKDAFSNIGPFYNSQNFEVPVILLTASEGNFMLAEAALRWGLSGGKSAAEYYEAGVKTSLEFYRKLWTGGNAYTVAEENAYLAAITYNASASEETQLEQIMVQKWIALFTNGAETFIEVRRTGYPKMDDIVSPYPGGNEAMPTRFMYSSAESSYNSQSYTEAAERMGGDTQYTKVWIDGGK